MNCFIRTLSRIDNTFINIPIAETRDFRCRTQTFGDLSTIVLNQVTKPLIHAAIQKPASRAQEHASIQAWLTRHWIFCLALAPTAL